MGGILGPDEPKIDKATLARQEEEKKRTEAEKLRAEQERREEQTAANQQRTQQGRQRRGQRSLLSSGATGLGGGGSV